jgi:hypothetical protein
MKSAFWLDNGSPTKEFLGKLRAAEDGEGLCEFAKHLISSHDEWTQDPSDSNWEWYLHCRSLFQGEYKESLDAQKPQRKAIPKSVRFEVFKRDSFTCQYCGSKAPEVVLHVDHLVPVAAGGENDLLNLITSCEGCNLGKSDKALDDQSMLIRQRDQVERLNERRQQLQMLLEWRDSLASIEDDYVEALQRALAKYSQFVANDHGVRTIRKWLKKYSLADLLEALDTSFSQYLIVDVNGNAESQNWNKAFDMIPRIAAVNARGGLPEHLQKAFYARGILRRRLSYMNEREVMILMKDALADGLDPEQLIEIAKEVRSWSEFKFAMLGWGGK